MRFKVDENLPVEIAELLTSDGHDAETVVGQGLQGGDDKSLVDKCLEEERALVMLDLDFADIRAYPPPGFHGIIVLRVNRHERSPG